MFATAKRGEAMLHRRKRMPGAFDDDVDPGMTDECFPVVGDMRGSVRQRRVERCRAVAFGDPAHAREVERAFGGARSAIPTTCTPGVFGTCARYIAPNLPAPIKPTRTG